MSPVTPFDRRFWLAGAALIAALFWAGLVWFDQHRIAQAQAKLEASRGKQVFSGARLEGNRRPTLGLEMRFTDLSRDHTLAQVNYEVTPPVGGAHRPVWLNCGSYTAPVPDEHAVHSLEHGAIWITYRSDVPAKDVTRLHALSASPRVVISPYPTQSAPVIATAWGVQLRLDRADAERLKAFIAVHRDSRTAPEPNGPCIGGTGFPRALQKEARP
jgi:Protein of unknown function (DUF3105)